MVSAKIIAVGDEILYGCIQDTNSMYLARRLHELGIRVTEIAAIPDQQDAIKHALSKALADHEIVLTSGGLGPTPVDQTRSVAARLFNRRLVLDDAVLARIERQFSAAGKKMPAAVTRQALIPHGSIALDNPIGHAPGLILVRDHKALILLPGVPIELTRIFETGVVPFLEETYFLTPLLVRIIHTTGIPEAEILDRVTDYSKRHRSINVGYLPTSCGVDIRLWTDRDKEGLKQCTEELSARLRPHVYAYDGARLEDTIGDILRTRHQTISVAESLSGGLIASRITDVPGSSVFFRGGAVAYSDDLKRELLGVADSALRRHGAVSQEVATQMAEGAKKRFRSDFALAVTGVAGPGGGTETKPVGLVHIALASPGKTVCEEHRFAGTRLMVKEQTAISALDLLRRHLQDTT